MLHQYFAYGLNIHSEIECPELLAGENSLPDVTVHYGAVPKHLEQVKAQGKFYEIAPNTFLLNIDGTLRFLVSDGEEIIIVGHVA